ncbi:MAG: hypothetical protein WA397_26830 [Roseiarcus sp.]
MFWKASTAIEGLSGRARRVERADLDRRGRLLRRSKADLEQIHPDWFGNVLEHDGAEISNTYVQPRAHLPISIF